MTDEVLRLRARTATDAKAVSRDLPDFVDAMLVTGVRVGEVCAITWDALDLDNRLVEIRGTVIRLKVWVLHLRPKSEAGYRTLRLPHWFISVLRARKERITEPNEWNMVFTSPLGRLRDPSNTSADIRDLVSGGEFAGWLTSHTFRKTAATLMDDEGVTARLIADQLGHARPSMTQDVYMARRQISEAGAVIFERFGTAR